MRQSEFRDEGYMGGFGNRLSAGITSVPIVCDRKTNLRIAAMKLAILALALILPSCGDSDPNPTIGSGVQRSQRVWIDSSRTTPRTPGFAGADSRTLRTLLWLPPASTPAPLLILAHGFGGSPEKFEAFATTLAQAGYVVVAPVFPLTNENAPGGHEQGLRDLRNQPGDVSYVITQALRENGELGSALHGRIAESDVAVLGHSLGAVTTIALTRKDCCSDSRVRATILVAPLPTLVDLGGFGGAPTSSAGPPTLLIHGTADMTASFAGSEMFYDAIDPPRFFVALSGVEHSEAVESHSEPAIAARRDAQLATLTFLDAVFHGNNVALDRALASLEASGNPVRYQR